MREKTFRNIQSLQSLRARLPAQLSTLAETMHNHAKSRFNNMSSVYDLEYTVWDDGDYRLEVMKPSPGGPREMQLLRYNRSDGCIIYADATFVESTRHAPRHVKMTNKQQIDDNVDAPKRLFDGYDGEGGRDPL